jgi:hypothetical protein
VENCSVPLSKQEDVNSLAIPGQTCPGILRNHDAIALTEPGREPQLRGDGGFHLFRRYAQDATRLAVDEAAPARAGVAGEIILNDLMRRFPGVPDLRIRGSEQDDYRDL